MQNHKYHLIYATCNSQQMTDKKKIMKTVSIVMGLTAPALLGDLIVIATI